MLSFLLFMLLSTSLLRPQAVHVTNCFSSLSAYFFCFSGCVSACLGCFSACLLSQLFDTYLGLCSTPCCCLLALIFNHHGFNPVTSSVGCINFGRSDQSWLHAASITNAGIFIIGILFGEHQHLTLDFNHIKSTR